MSNSHCLTLCTCPDDASAQFLARSLVERRLAACVNILPGVQSIYRWQGSLESSSEHLLLIKTEQQAFEALRDHIQRHHPYQVPEIIALPVTQGSADYLQWISTCLRTET